MWWKLANLLFSPNVRICSMSSFYDFINWIYFGYVVLIKQEI